MRSAPAFQRVIVPSSAVLTLAPLDDSTRYILPVWCYRSPARGIYHDFRADYLRDPALEAVLDGHPSGFTAEGALSQGVSREQIEHWYREGYLAPLPPGSTSPVP